MKKKLLLAALVVGLILAGGMALAQQQGYTRTSGSAAQGWICPWSGNGAGMYQGQGPNWQGHAPARMQGRGPRGHMHDRNINRSQYTPYTEQQAGSMSKEAASQLAESYVAGNPNLEIQEISEQDNAYVATVVTKDGSLVERLQIDKDSGWMSRHY